MVPVTEDEVTKAEKVSHKKTWINLSSYVHHDRDRAEDTEAPPTSAVDPAPEGSRVRIKRMSWNRSYSKVTLYHLLYFTIQNLY